MSASKNSQLADLPTELESSSAWLSKDLTEDASRWLHVLSTLEIAELELAAQDFLARKRDVAEISRSTYPLATLTVLFSEIAEKLLHGAGVQVLRGLPVHRYPLEMAAAIFCGIGAHLGNARSQNAEGHVLGHVRDDGADAADPNTRIYQTNERQTFHTDSADVVGLMCLRAAKRGGDSLLVSATSIYNRMNAERPDLTRLLFDPIATDRRGEVPEGAKPFVEIPVFSWHEGYLTVFYQRQYIDSAQRFEGVMPLTPKHVQALDLFDALANDPSMHCRMRLVPGDIQFVYNHSMLHDRTAFVDESVRAERRHLLRLWLSMPGDRPLPLSFRQRYGSVKIGNRGGIITQNTRLHAPLE